ncbi:MAG: DinB family protein, partial [Gemmatimonadaceae bacterium]|nr:DinB family protein [Gemmatimonadaceae bacterium]
TGTNTGGAPITNRSNALASRLEDGARALMQFAESLTLEEWKTKVPGDGRTVGVIVHHVATMYPLEIKLAYQLAAGEPIVGVTWNDVHAINAGHATTFADVSKAEALHLLKENSTAAAAAIRSLSDAQLDSAAGISLNADAPLTCQFMLEDHAVRHSYHHLAKLVAALSAKASARAA